MLCGGSLLLDSIERENSLFFREWKAPQIMEKKTSVRVAGCVWEWGRRNGARRHWKSLFIFGWDLCLDIKNRVWARSQWALDDRTFTICSNFTSRGGLSWSSLLRWPTFVVDVFWIKSFALFLHSSMELWSRKIQSQWRQPWGTRNI